MVDEPVLTGIASSPQPKESEVRHTDWQDRLAVWAERGGRARKILAFAILFTYGVTVHMWYITPNLTLAALSAWWGWTLHPKEGWSVTVFLMGAIPALFTAPLWVSIAIIAWTYIVPLSEATQDRMDEALHDAGVSLHFWSWVLLGIVVLGAFVTRMVG